MKRSEALDKLEDILRQCGFTKEQHCGCCHNEPTIEDANYVLTRMEEESLIQPPDANADWDSEIEDDLIGKK